MSYSLQNEGLGLEEIGFNSIYQFYGRSSFSTPFLGLSLEDCRLHIFVSLTSVIVWVVRLTRR